jgi:hypothetical protein
MEIVFWVLNGVLAVVMLAAGAAKLARPRAALVAAGMTAFEDVPPPAVKLIGAAEVAGAVGLIVPALTGIVPVLAPLAALGLAALLAGAVVTHLRRRESPAPALVLLALAAASSVVGFVVVL